MDALKQKAKKKMGIEKRNNMWKRIEKICQDQIPAMEPTIFYFIFGNAMKVFERAWKLLNKFRFFFRMNLFNKRLCWLGCVFGDADESRK